MRVCLYARIHRTHNVGDQVNIGVQTMTVAETSFEWGPSLKVQKKISHARMSQPLKVMRRTLTVATV